MNIVAYNTPTDHLEKTYLGKSYASNNSSWTVKNTDRFNNGDKILVGAMGRERTEILTVSDKTAFTLTTDASKFPHDADDPVFVLEYDKVRIYRSTTGQAGAYSLLATVDMDVDNADNSTYYDDVNALTTYWYQLAYFDSVGSVESDHTDPIGATGYSKKQLGSLIPKVATEVGDPDFIDVDMDTWLAWCNDISDDLLTQAKRPYRFLKRAKSIDVAQDASSFPYPADLWKINYIEVNEIGPAASRTFRPKKVSNTEAKYQLQLNVLGGDYVDGIAIDDDNNEIDFYPRARVLRINAFTLHYYKFFTEFKSLSDAVETPNTLVYKLGLKYEYYAWKADSDNKYLNKMSQYEKRYNAEATKLQREKNIMADGPTGMAPDRKRYPQWGGRRYRQ